MKKILVILLLIFPSFIFSQEKGSLKVPDSESITINFLKTSGNCILKEIFEFSKIKEINCQIMMLTNISTSEKIGSMRLIIKNPTNNDNLVGILDQDEIVPAINSLNYMIEKASSHNYETYTEVFFRSRDGVQFGIDFDPKSLKWKSFIFTKSNTIYSASFSNVENLKRFRDIIEKAKVIIDNKQAQIEKE